jgi:hypothetical protein
MGVKLWAREDTPKKQLHIMRFVSLLIIFINDSITKEGKVNGDVSCVMGSLCTSLSRSVTASQVFCIPSL